MTGAMTGAAGGGGGLRGKDCILAVAAESVEGRVRAGRTKKEKRSSTIKKRSYGENGMYLPITLLRLS